MKALLVDDSRAMRALLGNMMKGLGFTVVDAGNGREALAKLKESGPVDIAMVDWNMPEMNGYEFVVAVRGDHSYDAMPIVMVTTETEVAHMSKALEAGANEYVMKPFTKDTIIGKLSLLGLTTEASV